MLEKALILFIVMAMGLLALGPVIIELGEIIIEWWKRRRGNTNEL